MTTNNVDIVNAIYSGAAAYEGNQYLDLVGYGTTGAIAQGFATTPGRTYDLTFAYANNPWSTPSASASFLVQGIGT